MSGPPVVRLYGGSSPGVGRERNEDSFVCCTPVGAAAALAVVGDGIGGHKFGDLASYILCRRLLAGFQGECPQLTAPEAGQAFLAGALERINRLMYARNCRDRLPRPMGTTVVAAIFFADAVVIANAGDSRMFEYLPGHGLRQLTTDHIPEPGRYPHMSKEMLQNAILRAVGISCCLKPDIRILPRAPGARYLLCSDGLGRVVASTRIFELLEAVPDPRAAISQLFRQAILDGSRDNITAILTA